MALQGFCCDNETGEIVTCNVNEETGEPLTGTAIAPIYIGFKKTKKKVEPRKYMKFPKCYMSKTKNFKSLKEQILTGSNKVSHSLLLIPTLTLFPAYICTFIVLLEVFLHVKCHIHNKRSKDTKTYYQSPFHVITSVFCGVCRDCDTASKVGELQDQRRRQLVY